MKYVIRIFFFFILINILFSNDSQDMKVMNELEDNYYKVYTIYTKNLNTKNLNKYFFNTDNFIAVYPKINLLYKERLSNIYFKCDNGFNIDEFINYYKSILEKNNYKKDSELIDYYGVTIEKIKIYSDKTGINQILNNCSICDITNH